MDSEDRLAAAAVPGATRTDAGSLPASDSGAADRVSRLGRLLIRLEADHDSERETLDPIRLRIAEELLAEVEAMLARRGATGAGSPFEGGSP